MSFDIAQRTIPMTSFEDPANHKSKLVYLWPGQNPDLHEAARQLGYYGYEACLIESPEQLFSDVAVRIPTGVLIDCSLACALPSEHKAELAALAQKFPLACISDESDVHARLAAVRMGCQAYFTRPLDTTSLLDTLDRLTAPGCFLCRPPQ